jgi:adenosylcobinamide-GDP ribazoletransferase
MNGFLVALGFLTVVPVRAAAGRPGDLGRAAAWFPIVGLLLGLVMSLAQWLLQNLFSPALSGALLVALWALLTGGLHLDGLADCGDGMLASATPERRVEIMHDPRLGAFGGLTLILFLILKVLATAAAANRPLFAPGLAEAWIPAWPLVVATVGSRWLVLLVGRQRGARTGGLGADFALGLGRAGLIAAGLVTAVVTLLGGPQALLAVAAAHLLAWLVVRLARSRLGGITGDVLGLTIELSELTILLTYAAHPF